MYYGSSQTIVPKRMVRANIVTSTGESFSGKLFVSGDQRIKDLLCGESQFIPFVTLDDEVHILNRKSILRVTPLEFLSGQGFLSTPRASFDRFSPENDYAEALGSESSSLNISSSQPDGDPKSVEDVRFKDAFASVEASLNAYESDRAVTNESPTQVVATGHTNRVPGAYHLKLSALPSLRRSVNARLVTVTLSIAVLVLSLGAITTLLALQLATAKPEPAEVALSYGQGISAYNRGDYEAAEDIFRPLAEDGHVNAQLDLGYMYTLGQGVSRDHRRALTWYLKAANQGDAEAQTRTGMMYRNGLGTDQDFIQAYVWLSLAANKGHTTAGQHRDDIARKISYADLAEAQRMEQAWLSKPGHTR